MISISHSTIEELYRFQQKIPEFKDYYSLEEIKIRISQDSIILKAVEDHQILGFKAGYALNSSIFYSWLGGVFPHYRSRGIAKQLLDYQEELVKEKGFQTIQVKSMNCFTTMVIFLIKNDYLISGYEDKGDIMKSKICFEKKLIG